eukprot:Sspe_Gene.50583::Locus_28145_Transcript_2_4_Confidence_0.625_Length_2022::g.50583::m.50583
MNRALVAKRDELGAQFSVGATMKPGWLQGGMADAMQSIDKGLLMAYRSTEHRSVAWGLEGLSIASGVHKKLAIAIETAPGDPASTGASGSDTFHDMVVASDRRPFFEMVVRMYNVYRGDPSFTTLVIHPYHLLLRGALRGDALRLPIHNCGHLALPRTSRFPTHVASL